MGVVKSKLLKQISNSFPNFQKKDILELNSNYKKKIKTFKSKYALFNTKINDRNLARTKKDFILSDSIRDELIDLGIELKDNPDGSTGWYVKI